MAKSHLIPSEPVYPVVVDPTDLRDLPPGRFGALVAAVAEREWDGEVDVSPPSPGGAVDVVFRDCDEERLLHASQGAQIDADAVGVVAALASERAFDAVAIVTTGTPTREARVAAGDAGIDLVDGEAFASLVADADVELSPDDRPPVGTVVAQLAGRWPERLGDVAVELAATVDGATEFDRELTRGSGRTDLDFREPSLGRVAVRMRFLEASLVVYVLRGGAMESVVRLGAHREDQPSVRELEADLLAAMEGALEGGDAPGE